MQALANAVATLLRPPVLTVLAVVNLALSIAFVAVWLAISLRDPRVGEPGTGDFMAFRVGAELIAEHRGAELYDFQAQQAVQERLEGGRDDPDGQRYLNPPGLAVVLAPLTSMPYLGAFAVWDAAMAAAAAVGLAALVRSTPQLPEDTASRLAIVALVVGYSPMLLTITGGQNTPLTFGLLALAWVGVTGRTWWLSGLAVGLLTYKPQYAVVAGLWLLATREWRALGLAGVLGLLHALLGAAVCGWDWPVAFLRAARAYGLAEAAEAQPNHFSWVRAAQWALPAPLGAIVGWVGGALVVARSGWIAARAPGSRVGLAALFTAGLLASPHLQYYDAGVLVIPVMAGLAHRPPGTATRLLIGAAWLAWPAWKLAPELGFQPLTAILVALWWWLDRLADGETRPR